MSPPNFTSTNPSELLYFYHPLLEFHWQLHRLSAVQAQSLNGARWHRSFALPIATPRIATVEARLVSARCPASPVHALRGRIRNLIIDEVAIDAVDLFLHKT